MLAAVLININGERIIIIGAGPAGLSAAFELQKHGLNATIIEMGSRVGGIARTEVHKGFRFDIGGHRFFTKNGEIEAIWKEVLGNDLRVVPRLSRIYYQGKFYAYPLDLLNTLQNLGVIDSCLILLSYLKWNLYPYPEEETFEQWVTNRFGRQLYERFFKTYTEKVWGVPCSMIRADWAAQRIKDLSLKTVVTKSLGMASEVRSLIEEFYYPRLGPGMIWERMQDLLVAGGTTIALNSEVVALNLEKNNRISSIIVKDSRGEKEIPGDYFISSMPLTTLMRSLRPAAPENILEAAKALRYRDFLIIILIINQEHVFPDSWIYIHSSEYRVGRIQNFKNWSADMVPDDQYTSLGMEYFCNEGDPIWEMDDGDLVAMATEEIARMGFVKPAAVEEGLVLRQRKAYPVYDHAYRTNLGWIMPYVNQIGNLQTIGRNGMHRYNNQDHSMLTGMLAVRNLFGQKHDLWQVNTDRSYYERFIVDDEGAPSVPFEMNSLSA